jgi:hypothetical protein
VVQPSHASSMRHARAAGRRVGDGLGSEMYAFDVNEAWALIASDEAELGGRESRAMTLRELTVLLLAHVRRN